MGCTRVLLPSVSNITFTSFHWAGNMPSFANLLYTSSTYSGYLVNSNLIIFGSIIPELGVFFTLSYLTRKSSSQSQYLDFRRPLLLCMVLKKVFLFFLQCSSCWCVL